MNQYIFIYITITSIQIFMNTKAVEDLILKPSSEYNLQYSAFFLYILYDLVLYLRT